MSRYHKVLNLLEIDEQYEWDELVEMVRFDRDTSTGTANNYCTELFSMGAIGFDGLTEMYYHNQQTIYPDNLNENESKILEWIESMGGDVEYAGVSIPAAIATDLNISNSSANRNLERLAFRGLIRINRSKRIIDRVRTTKASDYKFVFYNPTEVQDAIEEAKQDMWSECDPLGDSVQKMLVEINKVEKENKRLLAELTSVRAKWNALRELVGAE